MPDFDFTPVRRTAAASTARYMTPETAQEGNSGGFASFKDLALAIPRGVEGAFAGIYGVADALLADNLPDWGGESGRFLGRSETTLGSIAEGITQFATGFYLAAPGRLLGGLTKGVTAGAKALGLGETAVKAVALSARQATSDFIAFDGHDERLSNLLQSVPALANPVSEYLAADQNDGEIEGRIKNVLEGLALDPIIGTVVGGLKAIKRFGKAVETAKAAGVTDPEALLEAGRKAGYEDPALREQALDAIVGTPERPTPPPVPRETPEPVAFSDILGEGHLEGEVRGEGKHVVSERTGEAGLLETVGRRLDDRTSAAAGGGESRRISADDVNRDFPAVAVEDLGLVRKFLQRVGPQMFADVRMVLGDFRKEGAFEFLTGVLRISNRAIRDGDFSRTAIHEYWHSLERNLSPDKAKNLRLQFEAERAAVIKAGGLVGERVQAGGSFTVSELEKAGIPREEAKQLARETYKYTSAQEWWAETLTEKTLSKFAQEAEVAGATGFKKLWLAGKAWLGETFAALGAKFGNNHAHAAFREFMSGKAKVTLESARGLGIRNIAMSEFTDPAAAKEIADFADAQRKVVSAAKSIDPAQPLEALAHRNDAEVVLNAIGAKLGHQPINLASMDRAGGAIPVYRALEALHAEEITKSIDALDDAAVRAHVDSGVQDFMEMAGSVSKAQWDAIIKHAEEVPGGMRQIAANMFNSRVMMSRVGKTLVNSMKEFDAAIKGGTISDEDLAILINTLRRAHQLMLAVRKGSREISRGLRSLGDPVNASALPPSQFTKEFVGLEAAEKALPPSQFTPEFVGTKPKEATVAATAPVETPKTDLTPQAETLPFEAELKTGEVDVGGPKAAPESASPGPLFEAKVEGGGAEGKATVDFNSLPFEGRPGFEGGGAESRVQAEPHPTEIEDTAAKEARNDQRAKRRTAQILEEAGIRPQDVVDLIGRMGGRREALKIMNRILMLSHKESKLLGVMMGSMESVGKQAGEAGADSFIKALEAAGKPRLRDAFTELYMNFILSGPKTLNTNTFTGAIGAIWRPLELLLGGIPESIRTRSIEPILAPFDHITGLIAGVGDAWKFAYMTLKDTNPRLSAFESGAAIGVRDRAITEQLLPAGLQETPLGSAMNAFGSVVTSPSRVLQATDEFFSQLAFRGDATVSLMREGRRNGLTGTALRDYTASRMEVLVRDGHALSFGRLLNEAEAKIRQDPQFAGASDENISQLARLQAEKDWTVIGSSPLMDYAKQARDVSQEFNFTKPLNKDAGGFEGIAAKAQEIVAAHPFLRVFVPFIRTPTNILTFAGRRVLGLPMAVLEQAGKKFKLTDGGSQLMADLAAGGIKAQSAKGRIMMGVGTMASLLAFADEGRITGAGPKDKDQKQALLASGWQPYSIKVGNQYVSFQRLDPLSTIFGIAADTMDYSRRNPDADANVLSSFVAATGIAMANNFTQKSYLMGFSSLIDALQDPEMNLSRITQRLAAAATIPNFSTQIAGSQDPYLRQIRSYLDEVQNKTFASTELEARRDIFGKPIERKKSLGHDAVGSWLSAVLPFDASTISDDVTKVEMARLRRGFAVPKPQYGGIDLRDVKDAQGRSAYDRWMSNHQEVKLDGVGMEAAVKKLIQSRDYKKTPDFISEGLDSPKAAAINGVLNKYRRAAYLKTIREVPALALEDQRIRQARARS